MARRVSVQISEDPTVNEALITTTTGQRYSRRVERRDYLGSPRNPMPTRGVVDKFMRNAGPTVGVSRAEQMADLFAHLDELPDIGELTRLFGAASP